MNTALENFLLRSALAVGLGLQLVGRAAAQDDAVLYSFTDAGTNAANAGGARPTTGFVLSGDLLYGLTTAGGKAGGGTVFSIRTNGAAFTERYDFALGPIREDGVYPKYGLVLSGNTLYGTTYYGGTWSNGTVFAVQTNGTGFRVLHTFDGSDGKQPSGSLVLFNNTLFGTTEAGGGGSPTNGGTVFSIRTDGTGFTTVHDFLYEGGNRYAPMGATPMGGVVISPSGRRLFGTTQYGGSYTNGTVFAVNVDGSGFSIYRSFQPAAEGYYYPSQDGCWPIGGLVLSPNSNTLYGTTYTGGASGYGTVFAIGTDGSGFRTVQSFQTTGAPFEYPDTFGVRSMAPLVFSQNGRVLYGSAVFIDGPIPGGTVFAVTTNGSQIEPLYTCGTYYVGDKSADGAIPNRILRAGKALYGTMRVGGLGDGGIAFRLGLGLGAKVTATPELARLGDTITVVVEALNRDADSITNVQIKGPIVLSTNNIVSGPEPRGPTVTALLAPVTRTSLTNLYQATNYGSLTFTATATGIGSDGVMTTSPWTSSEVTIVPNGDLLIKRANQPDRAYALEGVYQSTPSGKQLLTQNVTAGLVERFDIQVRNDAASASTFTLGATENSAPGWTVAYLAGLQDISAAIRAGTFTTDSLSPGGSQTIHVSVQAAAGLTPALGKSIVVNLLNKGQSQPTDAVGIEATQTSLSIETDKTRVFVGDKIVVNVAFANMNPRALSSVTPGPLQVLVDQVNPGAVKWLSGPTPATASLPAGTGTNFTYEYQATASGLVSLQAQVRGQFPGGEAYSSPSVQTDPLELGFVRIVSLEPVQSVYYDAGMVPTMVADKPTLVRVTLDSTFPSPEDIDLTVAVKQADQTTFSVTNALSAPPGVTQFLVPKTDENAALSWFTLRRDAKVEVTVNPSADYEYDGKQRSASCPVVVVRPLKLGYVRLFMDNACAVTMPKPGEPLLPWPEQVQAYARRTHPFIQAMFPVPRIQGDGTPLGILVGSSVLPNSWTCDQQLRSLEYTLLKMAKASSLDAMVGVLPHSLSVFGAPGLPTTYQLTTFFEAIGQSGALGEAFNYGFTGPGIVCTLYGRLKDRYDANSLIATGPGVLAHEIGHVFGLALPQYRVGGMFSIEEYNDKVIPQIQGRSASEGVWIDPDRIWLTDTDRQEIKPGVDAVGKPTCYNFMASADMLAGTQGVWIGLPDYRYLLEQFERLAPDPSVVLVSGTISDQGIQAANWYTFAAAADLSALSSSYEIRVLDPSRHLLYSTTFQPLLSKNPPAGSTNLDAAFAVNIPKLEGAHSIQILRDQNLLYERTASPNAPVLTQFQMTPAGSLTPGTTQQLAWQTSDADGDRISYLLRFSADDGATWTALAADLATNTFAWTVPDIATDFGRIEVSASDGFNCVNLVSPRFAIIGDSSSPLRARAGIDQVVYVGQTVTLDGSMSRGAPGASLSCHWRLAGLPNQSQLVLTNADAARTSFVPDQPGGYLFELSVSTLQGETDRVYTTVRAVPPSLQIALGETSATLSWPATTLNFVLENTSALAQPTPWEDVGVAPASVQGTNVCHLPFSATSRFYRLRLRQ